MLKYPDFSRYEFANVLPDVAVDVYLKLRELDQEISRLEQELADADRDSKTKGRGLLDRIVSEVKGYSVPSNDATLGGMIERLRPTLAGNLPAAANGPLQLLTEALAFRFSSFDEAACREALEAFLADELKTDFAKAKLSANGKLGAARDKRRRLLTGAAKTVFKSGEPPARWRHYSIGGEFDAVAMAETILREFVASWTQRSKLFYERTTASGVEIAALPPIERAKWLNAFDRLGLDRLPKAPIYFPVKA
jgi:hypothetical protein